MNLYENIFCSRNFMPLSSTSYAYHSLSHFPSQHTFGNDSRRPQLWQCFSCAVPSIVYHLFQYYSGFCSMMSRKIQQMLVNMSTIWWGRWALKDVYHEFLTVTATIPECGCVLPWHTYTLCQKSVPLVLSVTCPPVNTHTYTEQNSDLRCLDLRISYILPSLLVVADKIP